MPSKTHPALYERAAFIAPGRADDFLKWLDENDAVEVTGACLAPTGHVMLMLIDRDIISTWVSSQGDPWMSEGRNFTPGWYIVRTDDTGFVWGIGYGGWCEMHDDNCTDTHAEELARADFAEAEAVYGAWLGDEEV